MEMNRKDIKHQLALMAQDRIFCRNAHTQQKILGALLAVCSMVAWITLTIYDTVQIWWGVELFPLMCIGFYLMLTKNNHIWNLYMKGEKEYGKDTNDYRARQSERQRNY